MTDVRRLCVFAGSSPGRRSEYSLAARGLGTHLVARGWELVYGGAKVGLMGVVANAVLESGGRVIGVLPKNLARREVAHDELTELRIVDSMHQRKAVMAELSDAFVALPGGLGTLEELFEVLTWAQLGLHAKPCGVLNVRGYFDNLSRSLDHAVEERFLKPEQRSMLLVDGDTDRLLDRIRHYAPAPTEKWLDRDQT